MKKISFVLISFIIGVSLCSAQYYNPYQQAYQYGEQLVRQQQMANQKAYNTGQAMVLYQQGLLAVYNGDYDDAFDKFGECTFYDYAPACEALGIMYELGIGTQIDTDFAWECYKDGASKGNLACKQAIQRINKNGFYKSSHKNTWLKNFRSNYALTYGGDNNYIPNNSYVSPSTPSGSSSSTSSTCRVCGGSGVCTSCHGKGGEWKDTGYYTGSGNKSWISCPSCNRNKRCFNCHGTGKQ